MCTTDWDVVVVAEIEAAATENLMQNLWSKESKEGQEEIHLHLRSVSSSVSTTSE